MVNIPLGIQYYQDDDSLIPQIMMTNLIMEQIPQTLDGGNPQVFRRKRPGVLQTYTSTLSGNITSLVRTVGIFNNSLFAVLHYDNNTPSVLVQYDENDSNPTVLGPITTWNATSSLPNSTKVIYTQFGIVTLSDHNEVYVYPTDLSGLKQIKMPDGYIPQDIATINNYLIIACTTGRFYWLNPNTWDFNDDNSTGDTKADDDTEVLNYATCESLPDGLIGVQNVKGELYFFGQETTEVWQVQTVSSDTDSLFQKAQGRDLQKGAKYRNGQFLADNTVFWIGNDNILYRASDVPERISNSYVEQQIYDSTSCNVWTCFWRGHLLFVVDLNNITLAYDISTQLWVRFQSYDSEKFVMTGYQDLQNTLLYSSEDPSLYRFDAKTFTDNGNPIISSVGGIVICDTPQTIKNLTLSTSQNAPCSYEVSWMNAFDTDWAATRTLTMDRKGNTLSSLYAVGRAIEPFKLFQITHQDDTDCNIISLEINSPSRWNYQ